MIDMIEELNQIEKGEENESEMYVLHLNETQIKKFKRQLLMYEAYCNGFGYLRYSKRKHKFRIAVNKRTWWIIKNKMKKWVKH